LEAADQSLLPVQKMIKPGGEAIHDEDNADYQTADFWGPVSNFGIPIAAVMDTQKSPEL
jgi:hypothetical protein